MIKDTKWIMKIPYRQTDSYEEVQPFSNFYWHLK